MCKEMEGRPSNGYCGGAVSSAQSSKGVGYEIQ